MCQEETYSNPEKSRKVHLESAGIKDEIDRLYGEWEVSEGYVGLPPSHI